MTGAAYAQDSTGQPAGEPHIPAGDAGAELLGPNAIAPIDPHSVKAEAHTEAPGGHEAPFPPFNPEFYASQLLWLAITFGVFYYLMVRVALPRIAGILEDRRDRIASDLDHAQNLKEQSDAAVAAYEQALAEARAKALAIAEKARDEARAAADGQRAETEKRLAQDLAVAEARIADIKAKAISDVGEIATEAAEAVVETLMGGSAGRDKVVAAVTAVMGK